MDKSVTRLPSICRRVLYRSQWVCGTSKW